MVNMKLEKLPIEGGSGRLVQERDEAMLQVSHKTQSTHTDSWQPTLLKKGRWGCGKKIVVNDKRLEQKKGGNMASVHYQALEDRQRGSSGQVERWKIYKKEESSKEPSKTEENKKKKVECI